MTSERRGARDDRSPSAAASSAVLPGATLDPLSGMSALLSFLSHDLRSPLGPLVLATSSISEDETVVASARGLARFAEGQAKRLARLIDAALWSARGVGSPMLDTMDISVAAHGAAGLVDAIGIACSVDAQQPCIARAHRTAFRDVLVMLIECASGDSGTASIGVRAGDGRVGVTVRGGDLDRLGTSDGPGDWRRICLEGSRLMIEAHGGVLGFDSEAIRAWLPEESA